MKTIKVIDLLVDIANNGVSEKTKHFKYFDRIDEEYDIRTVRLEEIYYVLNYDRADINDEVEIIEDTPKEDNKIEKLGAFNIKKFYDDYPETARFILEMFKKQEELIDKVNGE